MVRTDAGRAGSRKRSSNQGRRPGIYSRSTSWSRTSQECRILAVQLLLCRLLLKLGQALADGRMFQHLAVIIAIAPTTILRADDAVPRGLTTYSNITCPRGRPRKTVVARSRSSRNQSSIISASIRSGSSNSRTRATRCCCCCPLESQRRSRQRRPVRSVIGTSRR